MGLEQKKKFFEYEAVSNIRLDSVVLFHDPVLGDVNLTVSDLLTILAANIPAPPPSLPIYTDSGGSGKQCTFQPIYRGKSDPDPDTGQVKDMWDVVVTTV